MGLAIAIFLIVFAIYICATVDKKRMAKLYLIKTHKLVSVQPEIYPGLQEDSSKFLLIIKSHTGTTYHYWYVLNYGGLLHREVTAGDNFGIYVIETDTTPMVEVWHNADGYTEMRFMIPQDGLSVITDDTDPQDDYYWSW